MLKHLSLIDASKDGLIAPQIVVLFDNYREARGLTDDQAAKLLDPEIDGQYYWRFKNGGHSDILRFSQICKIMNIDFVDQDKIIQGTAVEEVQALLDKQLRDIGDIVINALKIENATQTVKTEYVNSAYDFLHNKKSPNAFWHCLFRNALKVPCLRWEYTLHPKKLLEIYEHMKGKRSDL